MEKDIGIRRLGNKDVHYLLIAIRIIVNRNPPTRSNGNE